MSDQRAGTLDRNGVPAGAGTRMRRQGWDREVMCPPEFAALFSDGNWDLDSVDTTEFLLRVWKIPAARKCERRQLVVEGLKSGPSVVHAAARTAAAACSPNSEWFLDVYTEAIFHATATAKTLQDFTDRAGVSNAVERLSRIDLFLLKLNYGYKESE